MKKVEAEIEVKIDPPDIREIKNIRKDAHLHLRPHLDPDLVLGRLHRLQEVHVHLRDRVLIQER